MGTEKTSKQERVRKSERMTSDERVKFTQWVGSFLTRLDAAEALGVHVNTIDRLLITGQGSPATIKDVRTAIKAIAA